MNDELALQIFFNVSVFRITHNRITDEAFDNSGYYTIVVTELIETNSSIMRNILEDCWERHITNVNILVQHEGDVFVATLYTYFPFQPSYCEKVVPIIWNYFNKGHLVHQDKDLFPQKLRNLHQCPLTIVTVEIPPYIFIGKFQTNDTYFIKGIDANLIQVLSERMNFRPIFIVPDDIPRRGIIYKNGTVTGAFGMVNF